MTQMQKFFLLCFLPSPLFSFAASVSKTILPDNVITCQPNANCSSKTLYGRKYEVINTPRFTVMVSVSQEGPYTRADVSIANNTIMSQSLTPEDFRVEVVTPKPKVLLYVAPADLKDLPLAPVPPPSPQASSGAPPQTALPTPDLSQAPSSTADATHGPSPAAEPTQASSPAVETTQAPATDQTLEEAKKVAHQEASEKAASEHPLEATSLPPNEVTRGRVYFESDKHAKLVNIVLPIAGLVFEFPHTMK